METNFSNSQLQAAIEKVNADKANEFSESSLWDKIKRVARHAGKKLIEQVLLLYYVMKEPSTPFEQKMIIVSALVYFICPFDLIPDAVPVVGFADDAAAVAAALSAVAANITPEIRQKASAKAEEIFG